MFKLPWDVYNKHFKIVRLIDDKMTYIKYYVKCLHCVSPKTLCADIRSTSNLRKHLVSKHKAIFNDIGNDYETKRNITFQKDIVSPNKRLKLIPGQPTIKENFVPQKISKSNKTKITQSDLDTMVQKLIINQCLPFSLVESEDFRLLIQGGYPMLKLISQPTLMKRFNNNIVELLKNMKKEMSFINHITTTADCWSIFKRSYIDITGHWINVNTLERVSCLLAIKRLKKKHSYDVLAKSIESIYSAYDINNKILYTTIDNRSNFVNSFKIYGKDDENSSSENSHLNLLVDQIIELSDEESEQINEEINSESDLAEGVTILPIVDVINISENNDDYSEIKYVLPKHQHCADHTLNLIATKDSENALCNNTYKRQSQATFAKLNCIFNKQNRSTQIADGIKSILGVYLITPNVTRWNSFYDSVRFLLSHYKLSSSKFNSMCDEIKVLRIHKNDMEFMEEYCEAMKPLAISLDILKGEHNMYFGLLLPTISELLTKVEKLKTKKMSYCQPLLTAIIDGILKRFGQLMSDKFLIIAAVSHPFFKTAWILNDEKKNEAISLLKEAIILAQSSEPEVTNFNNSSSEAKDKDASTSFFTQSQKKPQHAAVENELGEFLKKSPTKKLNVLNSMPNLKKVFIQYNTPLPSSALVERIFSVEGAVLSKKRGKMSDDNFEKTMLLKSNKQFWCY